MRKNFWIANAGGRIATLPWFRAVYHKERIPHRGACVFVANHSSFLDGIVLSAYLNLYLRHSVHTIAYQEPFAHWLMGWVLRSGGCIPFDRKDRDDIWRMMREAVSFLANGEPVTLFPEGHLNDGTKLRLPRPGAALLALESGAPFVPVGIRGSHEAFPLGVKIPRPRRIVELHFGHPIDVTERSEAYHASAPAERRLLVESVLYDVMTSISDLSGLKMPRRLSRGSAR